MQVRRMNKTESLQAISISPMSFDWRCLDLAFGFAGFKRLAHA
jgi:hypothetical protein